MPLVSSIVADHFAWFDQQITISCILADLQWESDSLNNRGNACATGDDLPQSVAWLESAVHIARECGDLRRESVALGNLGIGSEELGAMERSHEYYAQALDKAHASGNQASVAAIASNWGMLCLEHGNSDEGNRLILQQDLEVGAMRVGEHSFKKMNNDMLF